MANVKITVETVDKGSSNVRTAEQNLKNLMGTVGKLSAGVAAAGVVFKQAFDFSQEGANLNQLEQSFTYLNDTILKTPNLLEDLKAASRGTMTEAQMMAGVLKMVAGSSDEMAMQMAAASPQLMEIAKAAQKLNPTLGDTAYLYESITTGIKRGSPLILDNLGIVIKVEESYQRFAESIGKTVTELTSEERSLAILNATLASGGNLIRQVGGDVTSQGDAWAQLTVYTEEATNAFKQWLAEQNVGTISGIANVIDLLGQRHEKINEMLASGYISQERYNEIIKEQTSRGGNLHVVQKEIIAGYEEWQIAIMEAAAATESFDRAHIQAGQAVEQFNEILSEQAEKYRMNAAIANDYQEASLEYEVTAEQVTAAEDARVQAHEEAAKAMEETAEAAQKARQAQADFFNSLVGNNDAMAEWNSIMGETSTVSYQVSGRTADQEAALSDLRDEYQKAQEAITSYQIGVKGVGLSEDERNQKIQEQLDYMAQLDAQMQPLVAIQNEYATATQGGTVNTELLNQKLFEQIQASTDDATAIALAGVALGQFTEEQANAMLKAALLEEFIRGQAQAFGEGKVTIEGAQEAIANFIAGLENIPPLTEVEVRTNWTQTGNPPPVVGGGGPSGSGPGGGTPQYRAGGGSVMAGHAYIVGERGKEMFVPSTSGTIVPNDKMGGGGGIHIAQLTVNAGAGANGKQIAQEMMYELGRLTRQQVIGRG